MNTLNIRNRSIALLVLLLAIGNTTLAGWGNHSILATDAHISELALGKDKAMRQPTDEFGVNDTIFAAAHVADNKAVVKVKGRLHVVEIAGQKPGPIAALDVVVTIKGEGTAEFSFSKPTKGWPLGTYKFEALLLDANGEQIDSDEHEFVVH